MPYARPTFTQLRDQAVQQFVGSGFIGASGLLRFSPSRVLAYVLAGFAYLHYLYQDWIARESVPFTATDERADSWGNLIGVGRQPASVGQITAAFAGNPGSGIAAGQVANDQNGNAYVSLIGGVVSGATATATFAAVVPGSASNPSPGASLTLATAVPGIIQTGTVTGAIALGVDAEQDAPYRTRYLAAYANQPQGGANADYVRWALAVPGVTRAWCKPLLRGAGTVSVFVMLDGVRAVNDGFPQGTDGVATAETRDAAATGDQLLVANAIYPLRPVTALVYVQAPVASPINFVLQNVSPSTPAIQSGIQLSLQASLMNYAAPGTTIYPNYWEAAINGVSGINTFTVVSPSAPITVAANALPVLGTITYQ